MIYTYNSTAVTANANFTEIWRLTSSAMNYSDFVFSWHCPLPSYRSAISNFVKESTAFSFDTELGHELFDHSFQGVHFVRAFSFT